MKRLIYKDGWHLLLSIILFSIFLLIGFGNSSTEMFVLLVILLLSAGVLIVIGPILEEIGSVWTNEASLRSAIAVCLSVIVTALLFSYAFYNLVIEPINPVTISSIRESEEKELKKENEEIMRRRLYPELYEEEGIDGDTTNKGKDTSERGIDDNKGGNRAVLLFATVILIVICTSFMKVWLSKLKEYIVAKHAKIKILQSSGKQQVILAFHEMYRLLKRKNYYKKSSMTVMEYADIIQSSRIVEITGISDAASVYEKVIYADYYPSQEECDLVKNLYLAVKASLS